MMKFYKYQGAGNDFLIADNRDGALSLTPDQIASICDRRYGVGADGLMLLEKSSENDFHMTYFNSDGSGGMMCGNGGRCMVAFAADRGVIPVHDGFYHFDAADGFHAAQILSSTEKSKSVRLKMKDVSEIESYQDLGLVIPSEGYFLDTGTRHYVRFVDDLDSFDVVSEGRIIRYSEKLQPLGANVNYVQPIQGGILKVRTYEKGVEDETFACGTGIVASCLAASHKGVAAQLTGSGRIRYDVKAKKDDLSVDFIKSDKGLLAEDIWLTGPAQFVAEIIIL